MPQTGKTPIQLYYSKTPGNTPVAGNLIDGELAINTADGKLFYKDNTGAVKTFSSGSGFAVGETIFSTPAPATGTWLETGKYYSKAAYPALATALGNVPDIGDQPNVQSVQFPISTSVFNTNYSSYVTATDGTTTVFVGTSGAIRNTTDGVNWKTVPSKTTIGFYEVQYINGNFVAVGQSGNVFSSTDGSNWISRQSTLVTANNLSSVAYGNGKYVAVGASGTIIYSSDLDTWTLVSSGTSNQFYRVVYANGLFIAVGLSILYKSSDGVTWTAINPSGGNLYDVRYAAGIWVAVGGAIYSSTDGTTWTLRAGAGGTLYDVAFVNNTFVAVGAQGYIAKSTDGITWTVVSVPSSGLVNKDLHHTVYDGTTYTIVGGASTLNVYLTSTDLSTWSIYNDALYNTAFYSAAVINGKTVAFGTTGSAVIGGASRSEFWQTGPWSFNPSTQATTNPRTIAYNGSNLYVAAGGVNGFIMKSTDGVSWVNCSNPTVFGASYNFDRTYYLNGRWFVLGGNYSTSNIASSTDATTWTFATTGINLSLSAASYGASTYVVVGTNGSIVYSTNGTTWTAASAGTTTFNDVVFGNSIFVAVGNSGVCYSSTDGITWTSRSAGANSFMRVIYANSLFVATGASGAIYTSTDGITWTSRTSNVSGQLNDVIWNGTLYCAVGSSGVITTSPDGTTWTARTPAGTTGATFNSVAWSGSKFIVMPSSGARPLSSTDGITWTAVNTNQSTAYSICYFGGKFLFAGNGYITYSTDGSTWTNISNVQYIPTTSSRIYLTNGVYFVLTNAGIFSSTDGVTFNPIRQAPPTQGTAVAYDGSKWYLAYQQPSGLPAAILQSTDGTTWTKACDIFTNSAISTTPTTINDFVYASGNFVIACAPMPTYGYLFPIQTSSNLVTWTSRAVPTNSTPTYLATDGSTIMYYSTYPYGGTLVASTDGGVTWSFRVVQSSGLNQVGYSAPYWVCSYYFSTDGNSFVAGLNAIQLCNTVVTSNGYMVASLSQVLAVGKNPYMMQAVARKIRTSTQTSAYKSTAILPNNRAIFPTSTASSNSTGTVVVVEIPLYSYDTSTTFYVPPSVGGQTSYIYAGA